VVVILPGNLSIQTYCHFPGQKSPRSGGKGDAFVSYLQPANRGSLRTAVDRMGNPVVAGITDSRDLPRQQGRLPADHPRRVGRLRREIRRFRISYRHRDLFRQESGNRQSYGPGPMSIKELARRETPEDTLHSW